MSKKLTPDEIKRRNFIKEQKVKERELKHNQVLERNRLKRERIEQLKRDRLERRLAKEALEIKKKQETERLKPKNRLEQYGIWCWPQTLSWAKNLDEYYGNKSNYVKLINTLKESFSKWEYLDEWIETITRTKEGRVLNKIPIKNGTGLGCKMEDISKLIIPTLFKNCKFEPNGPNKAPDWLIIDNDWNYHIEIKSRPMNSVQATGYNSNACLTAIENLHQGKWYKNTTTIVNMIYAVSEDGMWYKFIGVEIYPADVTIKIVKDKNTKSYISTKTATSFCMETVDLIHEDSYNEKRQELIQSNIGSGSEIQEQIISDMERKRNK